MTGTPTPHLAALFAYQGMATKDLEVPERALRDRGWPIVVIGSTPGPVDGFDPLRTVMVEVALTDRSVRPDLLVVPGGFAWRSLAADPAITDLVRDCHALGGYLLGVSTGALVLAAAGVLDDGAATGHWLALDDLGALGARVEPTEHTRAGRVFTAAGALASRDAIAAIDAELRWADVGG